MMSYFRCYPKQDDPECLLDPSQQFTTPWGSSDHGTCDKCGGSGRTGFTCLSCLSDNPREDCPACAGRVRFEDTCPVCEGSGEITRNRRDGVAVFPTAGGLLAYMQRKGVELDGDVIVELDGPLSGDTDLDADLGAVLIRPNEVVGVYPAGSTSSLFDGKGLTAGPSSTAPSTSKREP